MAARGNVNTPPITRYRSDDVTEGRPCTFVRARSRICAGRIIARARVLMMPRRSWVTMDATLSANAHAYSQTGRS